MAGQHLSRVAAGRRPLWRWLLVGLLLAFSLGVTAVYVATVAADLRQHHWAGALDASRDAVPAAVGWAALLLVFFARAATVAEQSPTADERDATENQKRIALARDSVRRAEQSVQQLAARLAEFGALAAQDGQDRQFARQIGDTAARLDLATQWLIGARAALAASQADGASQPDAASQPYDASQHGPASQPAAAMVSSARPYHPRGPRPPAGRAA